MKVSSFATSTILEIWLTEELSKVFGKSSCTGDIIERFEVLTVEVFARMKEAMQMRGMSRVQYWNEAMMDGSTGEAMDHRRNTRVRGQARLIRRSHGCLQLVPARNVLGMRMNKMKLTREVTDCRQQQCQRPSSQEQLKGRFRNVTLICSNTQDG